VETFAVGALSCNCSIIINTQTQEALVVDPGDDFELIKDKLQHHKSTLKYLWHTHAHFDHIGATFELLQHFSKQQDIAPQVFLHSEDKWLYDNIALQCQRYGMSVFSFPAEVKTIKADHKFEGFEEFYNLFTPGHTPGSCSMAAHCEGKEVDLHFQGDSKVYQIQDLVFTGDTLFRGSVGRTDLWGGDMATIEKSIRNKLYTLNAPTVVVPGHGPLTSIEQECEKNQFFKQKPVG